MTRNINQIVTDYETFLDAWETNDQHDFERGASYHKEAHVLGYQLKYVRPLLEDFMEGKPGHIEAKRID